MLFYIKADIHWYLDIQVALDVGRSDKIAEDVGAWRRDPLGREKQVWFY